MNDNNQPLGYPSYYPSTVPQPYAGVEDPNFVPYGDPNAISQQYPQPLGFGNGLENPYLPQTMGGGLVIEDERPPIHEEKRRQEEYVDVKGVIPHVDVSVDLPPQVKKEEVAHVDPHIGSMASVDPPAATVASHHEPERRNSIHITCPRIHCDCLPSCSDLTSCDFSCDTIRYMDRDTKHHIINISAGCLVFLLGLILLAISFAFFGIIGQDPNYINDPDSLIYIHRNCCTVSYAPVSCSYYGKYYSSQRCQYSVSFPVLGSSVLTSDPERGQNVVCSSNKTKSYVTQNSYPYSSYYNIIGSSSNVDCYTNKDENQVSLIPYSQLYSGFYTAAVVCISIGSSFLFIIIVHVGTYVYVKFMK